MQQKHKIVSQEHLENIKAICAKYEYSKGEIINILNDVQNIVGYLPKYIQQAVAENLGVSVAKIGGLVGFYSFFRSYPMGKHVITVCQGASCNKRNAAEVLEAFKRTLDLDVGHTTLNGKITLLSSDCMGACSLGPITMVNDESYPKNTPGNAEKIVTKLTRNPEI